jgi:predicted N-acyltransferase
MLTLTLHDALREIPAQSWDALHDQSNPLICHAFLDGLERTGCLRPRWGWTPRHAALWDGDTLIAAAPAYLKDNSHGEFVFDHAWANAYARHGLDYFPKWLVAVPYSPVPGPRLLARDGAARAQLCRHMAEEATRRGWSSLHINFLPDHEAADCPEGWLARQDVQFHWRNPAVEGLEPWRTFDDFLAALTHKKRKNIRAERQRVACTGIRFDHVQGGEASESDLVDMHALYCAGFIEKGNSPALTLEFFHHLASRLPEALVLILARAGDQTIAGALCLRGADRLYGRYWGSRVELPGLHFETCYYQGIELCLREGLHHFEPGAQGEHKLARGFLPRTTHSRHWLTDPGFRDAIGRWCVQDVQATEQYRRSALLHAPFRDPCY